MSKPQNVHCRLCADLKPYDQLVDLGAEKEKKIRVLEKLSRLNVQVTSLSLQLTEDVLPKTVCEPCMESLCKAYHFVLDVETAQEALKVHLLVQNIKKDLDNNEEYKYDSRDIKVESDSNTVTERLAVDAESGLNLSESKLKNDEDLSSNGLSSHNVPDLHANGSDLIIKEEETNLNELQTDLELNPSDNNYDNDAETTNDVFQVASKVDATEIELKRKLEDDVDTNVFKKDFEVTVTGYQMEITSKLSLNRSRTDVTSNENDINDRDTLFIDTDSHNTINIDDNEIQNSPNVNNEITSSSEHDSINFQTRKRKLNDSNVNYSKSQQESNSNVALNSPIQYLNKSLSDNLKTNKPIVVLNKISIHNGNNKTLIISPLKVNESEFGRKVRKRDVGIDLNKNKSTDNKQLNINEVEKPTENEQHLIHDKSLTQLEFSWKQYIWQCGDCNKNFDTVQKLIVHSKLIHSSCGNYKCTDCYYSTSELYSFINHVKIHREYLSLSCYKCCRSFESPDFLQTHYDRFMKSNLLCSGCLDKFETNQELAKHNEMYTKEKSTSSEREVRIEKEVEMKGLEEKQYICDRCGKLFMYKHFLIYHIKIHHKL